MEERLSRPQYNNAAEIASEPDSFSVPNAFSAPARFMSVQRFGCGSYGVPSAITTARPSLRQKSEGADVMCFERKTWQFLRRRCRGTGYTCTVHVFGSLEGFIGINTWCLLFANYHFSGAIQIQLAHL